MINMADEFVIYDDMQYTKNDWRNRNKIKTAHGLKWLTIPVAYKFRGPDTQKINETEVLDKDWGKKHWARLEQCYKEARYFSCYKDELYSLYCEQFEEIKNLSEINVRMIKWICSILDIKTNLVSSKKFQLKEKKTERLISICQDLDSTIYLSGPSAKNYINRDLFSAAGIDLKWMNYSGYPGYEQLHGDFEQEVSILDLLFNCGIDSKKYMKSFE